jgi:hypothetical protein
MNTYDLAIIGHAACGIVAFVIAQVLVLRRDPVRELWLGHALLVFLVLLETFMLVAMASHWTSLPSASQVAFLGLAVLGGYTIWRNIRAVRLMRWRTRNRQAIIDHIGFVLIALFDGFAIVAALDLGAPWWLVAAVAMPAILVGRFFGHLRKRKLALSA